MRLLSVDNEMVVPVNKVVRVLVTGADVIHSFSVPAFGIKIDAIPGRLNETWFKADRERHVLRPVLAALRQRPRLHADRGAGGERGGNSRLGGTAKKKFAIDDGAPQPVAQSSDASAPPTAMAAAGNAK